MSVILEGTLGWEFPIPPQWVDSIELKMLKIRSNVSIVFEVARVFIDIKSPRFRTKDAPEDVTTQCQEDNKPTDFKGVTR